jgi:peptidoglycan hydrolase CwlO-like protein
LIKNVRAIFNYLFCQLQNQLESSVSIIDNLQQLQESLRQQNVSLSRDLSSLPSLRARCSALEKQLSSIPTSLVVAGAELKVMEAKMQEYATACERKEADTQKKSAQMLR